MKAFAARIVVAIFLALVVVSRAQAAVLIVNNTQDSGSGSLRDTIAGASAGDKIEFNIPTSDPGYDPATGVFTIALTGGEIVIQSDLTMANPSGAKINISGNQSSRIFNITGGSVSISDLTLIDGKFEGAYAGPILSDPGSPGMGGAIFNQGTLVITRCTFTGNIAKGGGGTSSLPGCSRGGDGQGGAIANQNSLSLVACTLVNNAAQGGPGGTFYNTGAHGGCTGGVGSGGAIHNFATGNLSLSNCTIVANSATAPDCWFGSIACQGAAAQGGGIANFGNLSVVHCTLANNSVVGGDSTAGFFGPYDGGASSGGSLYCAPNSVAVLGDTIFAPNSTVGGAPSGPPAVTGAANGPDVNGGVTSQGHNLLGRSDGCTGFTDEDLLGGTTDDTRLDPILGPLDNYGGTTQTLSLLVGSPAIDAANPADASHDQRYFVRNGPADIGSFEYQGTQPVLLANISTRLRVQPGDDTMIGGFIVSGTVPKTVIIRGIGPSLPIAGALADPLIEVHGAGGEVLALNDNWQNTTSPGDIVGSGLSPTNDLESALLGVLYPGPYSVVVRGNDNASGVGLFEVYDVDQTADSKLANISTRGFVDTGDNVMIAGTIIIGTTPQVILRAIGPSLANSGIPNSLADPVLSLFDSNGSLIASNDNWRDTQQAEIIATGIPPSNDLESAIVRDLAPGAYTAIVKGTNNTTGVGLIEVYDLN